MNTRRSTALVALFVTFAIAAPLAAQEADAAKEGEAPAAAMDGMNHEMMGETGCACPCMDMKSMHQRMMKSDSAGMQAMKGMKMDGMQKMPADSAHARAGMHAGMDSAGHAAMMQAHHEMMEKCDCTSGQEGENMQAGMQGMRCSMHGEHGAEGMDGMKMQGEGMQHRHGMDPDGDASADGEDSDGS